MSAVRGHSMCHCLRDHCPSRGAEAKLNHAGPTAGGPGDFYITILHGAGLSQLMSRGGAEVLPMTRSLQVSRLSRPTKSESRLSLTSKHPSTHSYHWFNEIKCAVEMGVINNLTFTLRCVHRALISGQQHTIRRINCAMY
jgi:hypothetical protein